MLTFCGVESGSINKLVESFGLGDIVKGYQRVSYPDSLRLQATADVLLLVMWNDSRERDIFTGKFFEYVATDNPIFLIGSSSSELGRVIFENDLGFCAVDVEETALILKKIDS